MRKSGAIYGTGTSANVCPRCGLSKQSFATRRKAKDVARLVEGKKLRVYQCGPYWHLTSAPAEAVARGRARDAVTQ